MVRNTATRRGFASSVVPRARAIAWISEIGPPTGNEPPSLTDRHDMRCRGLDRHADVRMLEIFRPELLRELVIELCRRQVRGLHLADERKRDVAGQVDVIISRQIQPWGGKP